MGQINSKEVWFGIDIEKEGAATQIYLSLQIRFCPFLLSLRPINRATAN